MFDSNVYFGNVTPAADSHALTNDPLFLAPGLESPAAYGLRTASPAIDSGKLITNNGGKDFDRRLVPLCGTVDRGAMESAACRERQ
jgi:hypothetical protein